MLDLRSIFNQILSLESNQDFLFSAVLKEQKARIVYENKCEYKGWGLTVQDQQENETRLKKFNDFLNTVKLQIKSISQMYKAYLQKYLNLLASNTDMNLQLLCVRLNFNDYYKVTWQDGSKKRKPNKHNNNNNARPFIVDTKQYNQTISNCIEILNYKSNNTQPKSASCSYSSVSELLNNNKKKKNKNAGIWCCIGWEMVLHVYVPFVRLSPLFLILCWNPHFYHIYLQTLHSNQTFITVEEYTSYFISVKMCIYYI